MASIPIAPKDLPNAIVPIEGTSKYYTNCRGMNFLPQMEEEWKRSGYFPRYTSLAGGTYNASDQFQGTNKTSQWHYYHSSDNENSIKLLKSIGINAVRTFTDIYVWERNPQQFLDNINDFLRICDKHKMRVQIVLWDGISVIISGAGFNEPSDPTHLVSSLEHGLYANWRRVPHHFQQNIASAEGAAFYANSAIPFITQIAQTASSHQSLWSFDIANEGSDENTSGLLSSTGNLVSSLLSSIGIGITFGWAAGMNPFSATLTNSRGSGVGGTLATYGVSANPHRLLSAVTNFGTVHAYQNNAIARRGFVETAMSAALMYGQPAMSNENGSPSIGRFYDEDVIGFDNLGGFGHMAFDGLIERNPSYEAFRTSQGIIFPDGEVRDKISADAYSEAALTDGWLTKRQVNRNNKEKVTSLDEGRDGGYWSGVSTYHNTYDPVLFTSATESQWTAVKTGLYAVWNAIERFTTMSKNWPPLIGHPMDDDAPGYYWAGDDRLTFSGMVSTLYNWSDTFEDLSSMTHLESGNGWRAEDRGLWRREKLLALLVLSMGDQLRYLTWELSGSQYDDSVVPTVTQLAFSAAYEPLSRSASSVHMGGGPTASTSASMPCLATSSCHFNTPGDPDSGIDWLAYDVMYANCVDKLKDVFDIIEASGAINSRYSLYP